MIYAKALTPTISFTGQALIFLRLFFQWLHSERQKKSVVPEVFWYLSLTGGCLLLIYTILRGNIVFIFGQSTCSFIYLRNIYFLRRQCKAKRKAEVEVCAD